MAFHAVCRLPGGLWGIGGTAILRENVLSMAAGSVGAWWTGRLSVFWRAQVVGWGLFFLVDLVNRVLTYRSFHVALAVTLLVTPCLVMVSAGMRAVYTSHAFNNRLTPHAIALIGVLSAGAAAITVAIVFAVRQAFDWDMPYWGPVEAVVVPWIHYTLTLAGWSLCYSVAPERLAESLTRVERELTRGAQPVSTGRGVIALRTPKRTLLAQTDEIVAVRADGDFTHVFVADQPALMIWRTLAHFEGLLPSPPFLRLGRSLIVNRDRLRRVETQSRESARIMLQGMEEALTLGRAASARLREALGGDA